MSDLNDPSNIEFRWQVYKWIFTQKLARQKFKKGISEKRAELINILSEDGRHAYRLPVGKKERVAYLIALRAFAVSEYVNNILTTPGSTLTKLVADNSVDSDSDSDATIGLIDGPETPELVEGEREHPLPTVQLESDDNPDVGDVFPSDLGASNDDKIQAVDINGAEIVGADGDITVSSDGEDEQSENDHDINGAEIVGADDDITVLDGEDEHSDLEQEGDETVGADGETEQLNRGQEGDEPVGANVDVPVLSTSKDTDGGFLPNVASLIFGGAYSSDDDSD
jgi:hypothetical protein